MKVKLTAEQKETLSYDDVAHMVLQAYEKKMKIQDLFKYVIKAMGLPEEEFTNGIGDFFELLLTDKRFIMLENGFWDLKINHSTRIVLEDEEDDDIEIISEVDKDEDEEEDDKEINYDEDKVEDDEKEDGLEDLVIITGDEEDGDML